MSRKNVFQVTILIFLFGFLCGTNADENIDSQNQLIKDEIKRLQVQKAEIEARIADLTAKLSDQGSLEFKTSTGIKEYKKMRLPQNIKAIKELRIQDPNFMQNDPYGFGKDVAYKQVFGMGQVIQWINEKECLYDFAGSISSQLNWICLAYLELGDHHSNDLFSGRYDLLFEYVGVYSYITVKGSQMVVPKFKVIFYEY